MIEALLILGGGLELFGLGLVARDVRDVHQVAEATYRLVSGNLRRRAWGVGVFMAGVIVQTAANLAAL